MPEKKAQKKAVQKNSYPIILVGLMNSINRVTMIGHLTRDPELKETKSGILLADIGLALNRSINSEDGEKREETTFVDVVLWERMAELAEQYLKKGRLVCIEGRLQMDTWKDKATGQNRRKLKVVGENMQFLDGATQSEQNTSNAPSRQRRKAA